MDDGVDSMTAPEPTMPDGLAGELAAGLAAHAGCNTAVAWGADETIQFACGAVAHPPHGGLMIAFRAHVAAALLAVTQAAITSALGEAAAAIEELVDEWGDQPRKGDCPDGECGACTLGIAAQRLRAIVRDLAERGAK